MTKARLGSQPPLAMAAMSRKPSTLAGSNMPEMARPRPSSSPATRAIRDVRIPLPSDQVPQHERARHAGGHEDDGGGERARRQPGEAADAVAAGAAGAKTRAETDQQAADHGKRQVGRRRAGQAGQTQLHRKPGAER